MRWWESPVFENWTTGPCWWCWKDGRFNAVCYISSSLPGVIPSPLNLTPPARHSRRPIDRYRPNLYHQSMLVRQLINIVLATLDCLRTDNNCGICNTCIFVSSYVICGCKTSKVKERIAVNGTPSHSYGTSLAVWDHTVLPATRHKWTCPALTPATKPVLDLPTRKGWKTELT